jgi:enoyl-CoA hydratase/carnithine racemase
MYTGRRIPGDEALALGLVDRLVEQDQVRQTAQEMAAELAQIAPLALAATRATVRNDLIPAFRAATEREAFQQQWLRETDDFKEGVRASAERRPPKFTGT